MSADRLKYPSTFEDFHVASISYSLTGDQAKLNLVEEDGRCYLLGISPFEIADVFKACEDFAHLFINYSLEKERATFGTYAVIPERVRERLVSKDWCTFAQCGWMVRRRTGLLTWQAPGT